MAATAVPDEWQEIDAAELACWILDRFRGSADAVLPGNESDRRMPRSIPLGGSLNASGPSVEESGPGGLDSVMIRLTGQQATSADRALRIVDRRGGVLLADRVGEGKTYIAVALIEAMLARGIERVLVTGPAALRPQWIPLLRTAAAVHGASLVRHDRAVSRARTVTWLSHSMLSLRRWPRWLEPCDLVVVDEAHSMRNPRTQRYRSLAWLCRNARVVLLTATPINNSLLDLYHQLRLFIGDGRLADLGVPDLGAAMREAVRAGGRVRPPLDTAIAAVMVRQTRAMTRSDHRSMDRHSATTSRKSDATTRQSPAVQSNVQADQFPPDHRVATLRGSRPSRVVPTTVHYDPNSASPGLVNRVLDTIARLDLAPFRIGLRPGSDLASAPELLRFGLVKRFESGPAALLASLYRLAEYLDGFADAAADGYYLPPGSRRGCATRRDPAQLILAPLALRPLGPGLDPSVLIPSARSDARLTRITMADLEAIERPDPKTVALIRLLSGLPMRGERPGADTGKVVVFTEFRDTAIDLWRSLRTRFRVGLIHGGAAFIGTGACGRREVLSRFLPGSRPAGRPAETDEVDVLIATDVLAEGFNLQAASHVVSFDLPWNPVRLLQRAGRIDRLGSPHDVVYSHSFAPDRSMDTFLRLVDRIATKLDVIRNCMGLPDSVASIAHQPDTVTPTGGLAEMLSRIERSDPELFDDLETAQFSFLETGRAPTVTGHGDLASRLPGAGPHFGRASVDDLAERCWIIVVAFSGQASVMMVEDGPDGPQSVHDRDLATLLRRIVGAQPPVGTRTSSEGRRTTDLRREHPPAAAAVALAMGSIGFGMTGADSARARLINGLLKAIAREPGGPDAQLCARADAVVRLLRAGVSIGIEEHLDTVLQDSARSGKRGSTVLRSFEMSLDRASDGLSLSRSAPDPLPLALLELTPPVSGHSSVRVQNFP